MFQSRVFTLSVFSDDGEVNVVMTGRDTRKGFTKDDRGVDVKLLPHSNVPGDVASGRYRSEKDTLETHAVALQAVHGLPEQILPG